MADTPPPAVAPQNPPAPPNPETPPPVKAKEDPVLNSIYKTFGMAIDDDFKLKPIPHDELPQETDRVEKPPESKAATTANKDDKEPSPPPPTPEPPKPTPPPEPPAKPLEVRKPDNDEILEIQRKVSADLELLKAKLNAPPAPPPPPPKPGPDPDLEFDKSLPEENRETLELLKWAGESQPEFKGRDAELRQYYKKLDEFEKTKPEAEELEAFRTKHKPVISETALRKLAREKLKQEATAEAKAEARKELSPALDELRRKQYELEIKPILAEASKEFRMRFSSDETKLPEGVERIDAAAAREVMDLKPQEALKKHKILAPILQFHSAIADEYMALSSGLKEYNPNDNNHRFLDQFIFHQEQVLMRASEERRKRDGRMFLPTVKYQEEFSKDPESTKAKYWMFDDKDVRRMLEINAHRQAHERKKEIEEMAKSLGFDTTKKAQAAPSPPSQPETPPAQPAAPPSPPSPKGGSAIMPGAANNKPTPAPLMSAIGNLYPEAESIMVKR